MTVQDRKFERDGIILIHRKKTLSELKVRWVTHSLNHLFSSSDLKFLPQHSEETGKHIPKADWN